MNRSTSPPGGNQVDGLPPALSLCPPQDYWNRRRDNVDTDVFNNGDDGDKNETVCINEAGDDDHNAHVHDGDVG